MTKHLHIVFCGIDGSGKSTWVSEVIGGFQKRGQLAESWHGHGYLFAPHSFGVSEERFFRIKKWLKYFWPFTLVDHWFMYSMRYAPMLKKNHLVLDRYFYDKLARLLYYDLLNRRLAKFYLALLPRPDIVIFLDVAPAVAFNRKPDFTLEQFVKLRKQYLYLAKLTKALVVDTGKSRQVNKKRIFKLIWE